MRAAGETKNDFVRSKNRNQKESKMEEPLSERIETGENEQTMGFWGKLGNIFGSPTKTFEVLEKKPTWILPLGLLIVVSVILTQLAFPIIINAQLEGLRNNPNLTPEQIELYETQSSSASSISSEIYCWAVMPLIKRCWRYFAGPHAFWYCRLL
jgi:hypothetical protein